MLPHALLDEIADADDVGEVNPAKIAAAQRLAAHSHGFSHLHEVYHAWCSDFWLVMHSWYGWRPPVVLYSRRRRTIVLFILGLYILVVMVAGQTGRTGLTIVVVGAAVGVLVIQFWVRGALSLGRCIRTRERACRACNYSLDGHEDEILAEVLGGNASGPRRCPECGQRWPLLLPA